MRVSPAAGAHDLFPIPYPLSPIPYPLPSAIFSMRPADRASSCSASAEHDQDGVIARDGSDHLRPARGVQGDRQRLRSADHSAEHEQVADAVGAGEECGEEAGQRGCRFRCSRRAPCKWNRPARPALLTIPRSRMSRERVACATWMPRSASKVRKRSCEGIRCERTSSRMAAWRAGFTELSGEKGSRKATLPGTSRGNRTGCNATCALPRAPLLFGDWNAFPAATARARQSVGMMTAHCSLCSGACFPPEVLDEVEPGLREMGELSGGELYRMQLADRLNEPVLTQWGQWGERIDRIELTPLWQRGGKNRSGARGRRDRIRAGTRAASPRIHQFALAYLFTPSTDIFSCPLAMTDGAARVLLDSGNEELIGRAVPHLLHRDAAEFWTSGQWMTETIGGSDVGADGNGGRGRTRMGSGDCTAASGSPPPRPRRWR